jgi:hypothetical protein
MGTPSAPKMVLGVLAVLLSCVPVDAKNGGASEQRTAKPASPITIVSPISVAYGRTYAEWSELWWQWDLAIPVPVNPTVTPGADCHVGQSGKVWFLYAGPPTVNCTVPSNKALFFPVANTECSDLEPAPFHGDTPNERATCAKGWIDFLTNLSTTINGVPVENLTSYRTMSSDFRFKAPANNILGVPGPATGRSTGDGYYLMLAPLSPGQYTIHVTGTFREPNDPLHPVVFALDTTIHLTVVQGVGHTDDE